MSRPTRILYAASSPEVFGAERCLLNMVEVLDRDRYVPLVLVPDEGKLARELRARGVEPILQPVPLLRRPKRRADVVRFFGQMPGAVARVARLLRERRIDLVHTNTSITLAPAFAARAVGVRHFWHVRETFPDHRLVGTMLAGLVRTLSHRIFVISTAVRDDFFGRRPPARARTLYDGVDVAPRPRQAAGEVRAALGIPVDAPLVGAASRLTPWKGQDRFVQAAAKLAERFPTARFVVAGSPEAGQAHQQEYFESLKRLTVDLGIADRVLFPGYLSNLQDLMATMDVFVLPSVQPEPFGMVIVEAMALGVPVVATNGGGPREIVRDWETGLLVPPGDSAALADAVGSLLADSNMRARFGAAARDRVRDTFSLEAFRHNLHRLYREGTA